MCLFSMTLLRPETDSGLAQRTMIHLMPPMVLMVPVMPLGASDEGLLRHHPNDQLVVAAVAS